MRRTDQGPPAAPAYSPKPCTQLAVLTKASLYKAVPKAAVYVITMSKAALYKIISTATLSEIVSKATPNVIVAQDTLYLTSVDLPT